MAPGTALPSAGHSCSSEQRAGTTLKHHHKIFPAHNIMALHSLSQAIISTAKHAAGLQVSSKLMTFNVEYPKEKEDGRVA